MWHVEWYHVCWPRLTAKRVEPVVSISWASCFHVLGLSVRFRAIGWSLGVDSDRCRYALSLRVGKCKVPKVANGSLQSGFNVGSFVNHDSVLVYRCDDGFKNVTANPRCDNGTWTSTPICVPGIGRVQSRKIWAVRVSQSGQAVRRFQAPRKINFTLNFRHIILDDVKLAELSNNSFEWKNVTYFRGSKHTLTPPTYFRGSQDPQPFRIYAPGRRSEFTNAWTLWPNRALQIQGHPHSEKKSNCFECFDVRDVLQGGTPTEGRH